MKSGYSDFINRFFTGQVMTFCTDSLTATGIGESRSLYRFITIWLHRWYKRRDSGGL